MLRICLQMVIFWFEFSSRPDRFLRSVLSGILVYEYLMKEAVLHQRKANKLNLTLLIFTLIVLPTSNIPEPHWTTGQVRLGFINPFFI